MMFLPFNAWNWRYLCVQSTSRSSPSWRFPSLTQARVSVVLQDFLGSDASPIVLCVLCVFSISMSRPNQPHRCSQVVASLRKRKNVSSSPLSRKSVESVESVDRTLSFFGILGNPWCSRNANRVLFVSRHHKCFLKKSCRKTCMCNDNIAPRCSIYICIRTSTTCIVDSLHFITFHYISLHFITFHYISLHFITFHYISLP